MGLYLGPASQWDKYIEVVCGGDNIQLHETGRERRKLLEVLNIL
jgi:hypothetical protein